MSPRIPLDAIKGCYGPSVVPALIARLSGQVMIWSGEHGGWWVQTGCGYTDDADRAGRWSFSDAFDLVAHSGPEKRIFLELAEEPIGAKPGTRGATILTRSGLYFDFLDPQPDQISIEDIAHALANICRFGGHSHRFYSVAQHSVLVSRIVEPDHAFAGLMHDAAEAYVGDIPAPLKQLLPDFKAVEARVEAAVAAKFGLAISKHPEIKRADLVALATEKRDVCKNADAWGLDAWPPLATPLPSISIPMAKALFLERFHELTAQRELAA